MIAKKLIVTATETTSSFIYQFPVWEFEDGLTFITNNNYVNFFFEDRKEIKTSNPEEVFEVTETDSVFDWSLKDLQESIRVSLTEYGDIPAKALAMLS